MSTPTAKGDNEPKRLVVYWDGGVVGELTQDEHQHLIFHYDAGWLAAKRPALSISMPLTNQSIGTPAHHFFANLLPEGDYRRKIEMIFKASADNDFALLAAIGGDCAGALSIGASEFAFNEEAAYEPLSNDALREIIQTEGLSVLAHQGPARLSLAGAQGKLPLHRIGGKFHLPRGEAPSTCILKFNRLNHTFPRLVENEWFLTAIARQLGMPVVTLDIVQVEDQYCLVSERYDRLLDAREWPERLHQEDFCQALGFSHERKYEKEGGPSYLACANLARQHLTLPDLGKLLDWMLFNLMTGNCDAHAKNIAIVYDKLHRPHLAPFYDLVCTRAYPRLDRKLAMAIDGQFDPDLVTLGQLVAQARKMGITEKFMRERVKTMLHLLPTATQKAGEELAAKGIALDKMQHVTVMVSKLLGRAAKQLAAS